MICSLQSTFLPFRLEQHLVAGLAEQWWLRATEECNSSNNSSNSSNNNNNNFSSCVSPHLTSLHYVSPHMMYVLQFLTEVFTAEPDGD